MKRKSIVIGQMYIYRCKLPCRNLRIRRSTVIEYRVRVIDLASRSATVEIHYRDGVSVAQWSRNTLVQYATTTIGLRNLYPYREAWVPFREMRHV